MPFDDKDLAELEQLKEKLPLAAVLFVKVEVNLDSHDDDFSSLHGAERVKIFKKFCSKTFFRFFFFKLEIGFRVRVHVNISDIAIRVTLRFWEPMFASHVRLIIQNHLIS